MRIALLAQAGVPIGLAPVAELNPLEYKTITNPDGSIVSDNRKFK
jgi:hypothetical protein